MIKISASSIAVHLAQVLMAVTLIWAAVSAISPNEQIPRVINLDAGRLTVGCASPEGWFATGDIVTLPIHRGFEPCSATRGWQGGQGAADPRRLVFDGKDSSVLVSIPDDFGVSSFSIEVIFKPLSYRGQFVRVAERLPDNRERRAGFGLEFNASNSRRLQFVIWNNGAGYKVESPQEIPLTSWTYAAAVFEQGTLESGRSLATLYVAGTNDNRYEITPRTHPVGPLMLGNSLRESPVAFEGAISRVVFSDKALVASQVRDACRLARSSFPGLVCR